MGPDGTIIVEILSPPCKKMRGEPGKAYGTELSKSKNTKIYINTCVRKSLREKRDGMGKTH